MGEVYRARDTRLGRDVALKVLPESLTAEPDRLARFEREAKLLAALNHPHIAQIYGLEESDGQPALVLELVEGPTLADRIGRGPIPLHEALPIAAQIAEALEAAHQQGIVHRDLKPANVKVRPDGTVKVLDFGLAKAFEPETGTRDASQSATLSARATQEGVILGTAAYMSPEQARGKSVDKRTDIWAFGAVLYETLTGRRAFVGDDVAETLAAVMKGEPDWSRLPAATPPAVRRLLRRCLERPVERRLRDIGDARLELDDPPEHATADAPKHVPPPGAALAAAGGVITGLILAWLLSVVTRPTGTAAPGGRSALAVDLPADVRLAPVPPLGVESPMIALSPDGTRIVYVGGTEDGTALYLREIGSFGVARIPGTNDAVHPFFSPDGHWVGFLTSSKVKKVSLKGDPPRTLGDVANAVRAVWRDDVIYVAEGAGTLLSRLSSDGGAKEFVANLVERYPGSRWAGFTDVLPDGSAALAVAWSRGMSGDHADVHLLSLDTLETRPLLQFGYDARFAGRDHVVFARNGSLLVAEWDGERRAVSGEPRRVADGVRMDAFFGQAQYSVAGNGMLVYAPGGVGSVGRVARVDRAGRVELLEVPEQTYSAVDVAPDGERLALGVADVNDYLWIYDLGRREGRKLAEGAVPVWSPDGRQIAFSVVDAQGRWELFVQSLDGAEGGRRLYATDAQVMASSWSPDGRTLGITRGAEIYSLGFLDVDDDAAALTVPNPASYELFPAFSPDGGWIAFGASATGSFEIWVRSYPDGETVRQLSVDGGVEPVWCPNGELFFRTADRWMVTTVTTTPELAWDPPRQLFTTDFIDTPNSTWDVSPDGKYVFLFQRTTEHRRDRLHVLSNAFAGARYDAGGP
jgi:serine/threonine-protein kinase